LNEKKEPWVIIELIGFDVKTWCLTQQHHCGKKTKEKKEKEKKKMI